jgi:hypothetical protein
MPLPSERLPWSSKPCPDFVPDHRADGSEVDGGIGVWIKEGRLQDSGWKHDLIR